MRGLPIIGRRCLSLSAVFVVCHSFSASPSLPTWSDLERRLPSSVQDAPDVYSDPTLARGLKGKTVLYRDRNGWCPYVERVWLALEVKKVDYVTVLVDDDYTTVPSEAGSLPRIQWPDGTNSDGSDIYAVLERIEEEHSNPPSFYPDISVSVDIVRSSIERRFDGIMPRYTRPSSLAPYVHLTKEAGLGETVPQFKYEVALEEIDEILEEYDDGPFIAGDSITAADIYWAPFLERFAAQIPLLTNGVLPRSDQYEAVKDWYDAMDELVPCYSCRVKGRAENWQKVLADENPDLTLHDSAEPVPDLPKKRRFDANKVWATYAKGKPYLAPTPAEEVAAHIVRNRDVTLADVANACKGLDDSDAALREVCDALTKLGSGDSNAASKLSGDARDVASYLDSTGLSVPADLGVIPANALRSLVNAAPKPRI